VLYKTSSEIKNQRKDNETDWKNMAFTTSFIAFESGKKPKQDTKVKILWDKKFRYIYTKLEEKHIWLDLKKRDKVIFYNNDFEAFIDPSKDTHNYGEIEINAINTVWDFILKKTYNFGGKAKTSWDLTELKSAIFIKGTLNDDADKDEF
jgi:hypothetical protein